MKQQQGAALVIVMALLSGALMIGMSGMQSALIDERLAGNYRASVQSQMSGEGFLAGAVSDENSDNLTEFLKNSLANLDDEESKTLSEDELIALSGNRLSEADSNLIVNVSRSGDQITLEAWGAQAGAKAPTVITFNASGTAQNFRSPFLACRQVLLNGSSLAASCRSNDTVCSQDPAGFISAGSQTYNLLYNLSSGQGDSITLDGDADAYGNVRSQRDIILTGSSLITGNAYAQGLISQPSGTRIIGNAANITGTPQRCDVFFDSLALAQHTATLKQQYGKSVGNIAIGVYPRRQWLLTPQGLFYYDEREKARDCGFLGLGCFFSDFLSLLGFNVCNLGYVSCQQNQIGWVKHASVNNNTVVVNDLRLEQEPTFLVTGVQNNTNNNPAQLRVVVEGELSVSGGGNGLFVEDNAQLEIFVKGKTTLASNLQMGSGSATRNGKAPLSINSSYAGEGDAVILRDQSHLVGNIYAPSAGVTLLGSRVSGSVWANKINALGSSYLIFNEINSVADGQDIEAESSSGTTTGFKPRWQ